MSSFPIEMEVSRPVSVSFDADRFTVELEDGRALAVPYAYSPRLIAATQAQREHYELSPSGIHWPSIDEDLSVRGLLLGLPVRA